MMIGDPQGEVPGQITPCSNSFHNCFFTSSSYRIYCLCNPIFDNGESGNNCISCSTSLLGDIHMGSWNILLYSYNNSSKCCFLFLIHPSRDSFTPIDSSPDRFSRKKRKTYFLLELIIFFAWLALTTDLFDLPLCGLVTKDLVSLIRKYCFTLCMKITSLICM
jgi:hypothetical protein